MLDQVAVVAEDVEQVAQHVLASAGFGNGPGEHLRKRGVGCALGVGRGGGEQVDGKAGFRRA